MANIRETLGRLFGTRGESPTLASQKFFGLDPCVRRGNPRYRLAATAILKNEAPYLREWLEFHILVGVEHFYLYDNDSTDSTPDILEDYRSRGLATVFPWPTLIGWNGQGAAYAHSTAAHREATRWMMFIDADEYMFPETAATLQEVLSDFSDYVRISVPWRCFGYGGHRTRPGGLTIEQYRRRATQSSPELTKPKSIVDPCRVVRTDVHTPYVDAGKTIVLHDRILLNHYATRSEEEFAAKIDRGYGYKEAGRSPERLQKTINLKNMIEASTEEDDLVQRFVPPLKRRIETVEK